MNKKAVLILVSFAFSAVSAQQVVSTQGTSYSNGNVIIDFTIGEVVVNTCTDGTNDLSQGFHQTNWNFLGVNDFDPDYEAIIFPNPTQNILNIRTSTFQNVFYTLFDVHGKLIMQGMLFDEQTLIEVGRLSTGSYSLSLNKQLGEHQYLVLKTFKLVKTH